MYVNKYPQKKKKQRRTN